MSPLILWQDAIFAVLDVIGILSLLREASDEKTHTPSSVAHIAAISCFIYGLCSLTLGLLLSGILGFVAGAIWIFLALHRSFPVTGLPLVGDALFILRKARAAWATRSPGAVGGAEGDWRDPGVQGSPATPVPEDI